jgi:hypothetical protein
MAPTPKPAFQKKSSVHRKISKSHKKKAAPGEKFQCPVCNGVYGRKDTVRTHMNKVHPRQSKLPIGSVFVELATINDDEDPFFSDSDEV